MHTPHDNDYDDDGGEQRLVNVRFTVPSICFHLAKVRVRVRVQVRINRSCDAK